MQREVTYVYISDSVSGFITPTTTLATTTTTSQDGALGPQVASGTGALYTTCYKKSAICFQSTGKSSSQISN